MPIVAEGVLWVRFPCSPNRRKIMKGTVILNKDDLLKILFKHFEKDGITGAGDLKVKIPALEKVESDFSVQLTLTDEKI